jgi:rSAM/selenodomain-associated transferase 1
MAKPVNATPPRTLIIFSRYPEPGQTKTRLIPALGARGAAQLHQQMAELMIQTARSLSLTVSLDIQVWFTGGTLAQMQTWLGSHLTYFTQQGATLGDRLQAALAQVFGDQEKTTTGLCPSVVIIGTDCPHITPEILQTAFACLQASRDVVLGPAADGGYYLIGLKQFIPELFCGISWSSDRVLQQTLTIAQDLQLTVAQLPILTDIDRPEDLASLPLSLQSFQTGEKSP